jgi:hypothetical protein
MVDMIADTCTECIDLLAQESVVPRCLRWIHNLDSKSPADLSKGSSAGSDA